MQPIEESKRFLIKMDWAFFYRTVPVSTRAKPDYMKKIMAVETRLQTSSMLSEVE